MAGPGVVTLRPMTREDLPLVGAWLLAPHVARWWTEDVEDELTGYRRCIAGQEPTRALMIARDGQPVGWAQWYRWADYPQAGEYGTGGEDVGLDYAIGAPDALGRGVGTAAVAQLLADVARHHPMAPVVVCVDATNAPSRRVLEKNGFTLVELRDVPSEPEDLSALYRRPRPTD